MIVEFGHFALVLGFVVALVQGVVPLVGAQRGNAGLMAVAPAASLAQFLAVGTAFAALTYAYVVSDFSVLNVVNNSHTAKPLLYKITGVWGNHEGSLLLWVLILAVFGLALALFGNNLPPALRARALAIQALVAFGFLGFLLFTSNPFARTMPPPVNGQGLNPILQDPGLAFHPPFLYLGYVGFSMAFSFAVAALIEGRVDAAWARWVRPWTLAAWIFLTLGIGLGAWWAYYELGWGGWWFWDPVENASLLPWLAGTALLHSAIVVEKRDALKSWTILLAIITFALSLLGTFLVRSGVLTSVHAFASDPTRGVFILGLLAIVLGVSFALYAWRAPHLKGGGLFRPVSREGSLLLNNALMAAATGTVLLGTLFPLIVEVLGMGKVSVGPPYYNYTFGILMIPLVLAMAVGPMLAWKRGRLGRALARLVPAALAAGVAAGWGILRSDTAGSAVVAAIGMGLAAWLVVGTLVELLERSGFYRHGPATALRRLPGMPRAAWGMTLAHLGLGIAIAGMVGSSLWKVESVQVMAAGDSQTVAGYTFAFHGAREVKGPNYTAVQGSFTVKGPDGATITTLDPSKRSYEVRSMPTTEAAIHTTWVGDLYAVVGDPAKKREGFVTRLYYNPLVPWIWIGSVVMVLGGLVSLSDRRHRVGVPARARTARRQTDGEGA